MNIESICHNHHFCEQFDYVVKNEKKYPKEAFKLPWQKITLVENAHLSKNIHIDVTISMVLGEETEGVTFVHKNPSKNSHIYGRYY